MPVETRSQVRQNMNDTTSGQPTADDDDVFASPGQVNVQATGEESPRHSTVAERSHSTGSIERLMTPRNRKTVKLPKLEKDGDFEMWIYRYESSIHNLRIIDAREQQQVIIENLSDDVLNVLISRLYPTKLQEVSAQKVIDTLAAVFRQSRSRLATRMALLDRRQGSTESRSTFLADVFQLSRHCDYKSKRNFREEDIILTVVRGMADNDLRDFLMLPSNEIETTDDLLRLMKIYDAKTEVMNRARNPTSHHEDRTTAVCRVADRQKQFKGPRGFNAARNASDSRQDGRLACYNCGEIGHFARECRTKRADPKQNTNAILSIIGAVEEIPPYMIQLRMNGRRIEFMHDSGAVCTIVTKTTWEAMGSPKLVKSERQLRNFEGSPIGILGEIKVNVDWAGKKEMAKVVVARTGSCNLLGRDLMEQFSIGKPTSGSKVQWVNAIRGGQQLAKIIDEVSDCQVRSPFDLKRVAAETQMDESLKAVLHYTQTSWPDSKMIPDLVKPYQQEKGKIWSDGLCLWMDNRLIIPEALRSEARCLLHQAHVGRDQMHMLARDQFWYPGLATDIEKIAKGCEACNRNRANPTVQLHPWKKPESFFERVHIDFAGPFHKSMWLILVDAWSNWIEVVKTRSTSTKETIAALREIISRHGLPNTLVSDNGTGFVSREFETFCEIRGIKHLKSAPYHPSSNGVAERAVRTFKEGVTKRMNAGDSLDEAVMTTLYLHRTTKLKDDDETPAKKVYGRELRTIFTINAVARDRHFQPNQLVWVKMFKPGKEFWERGRVLEPVGQVMYRVQAGGDMHVRHRDQLKGAEEELADKKMKEPWVSGSVNMLQNLRVSLSPGDDSTDNHRRVRPQPKSVIIRVQPKTTPPDRSAPASLHPDSDSSDERQRSRPQPKSVVVKVFPKVPIPDRLVSMSTEELKREQAEIKKEQIKLSDDVDYLLKGTVQQIAETQENLRMSRRFYGPAIKELTETMEFVTLALKKLTGLNEEYCAIWQLRSAGKGSADGALGVPPAKHPRVRAPSPTPEPTTQKEPRTDHRLRYVPSEEPRRKEARWSRRGD